MKTIFLITAFLSCIIGQAQLFDINHIVDVDVGVSKVKHGDFDNDGDQDLLNVTSQLVSWYRNIDGLGTFSDAISIDSGSGQSLSQVVTDLDQDGNVDILISYFGQDFIAFYRNLGNGTFAPFETLASNLNQARGIVPGDLDGDGDLDLVLGVTNGVEFYWIEHLDGNGNFGPLIPISTTLSQARTQVVGDLDGDGDLDIMSNSGGSTLMSWFENTNGQGDFSVQHTMGVSGFYENFFTLADLDGDGDLDNLSNRLREVFWRENLDGLGNFGNEQTIFSYIDNTPDLANIHAVDLDNDGDLDITYDSGIDFGKAYHFNTDGAGNFGPANYVDPPEGGSTGNNQPVDLDGDGDMDLINTSLFFASDLRDLYWYENLTILGTTDFNKLGISMYPNPVKEVLVIKSPIAITKVRIYSILGSKLLEVSTGFSEISMSNLPSGLLLVELETEKGTFVEKVIKE